MREFPKHVITHFVYLLILAQAEMIDFLELFGWLIPITIAVFLVQYWGYYLIALFVIYFVTVRTLELISVSNLKNKAVFITGCDSGFGYGLSLKCLRAGMPVFSACFDDNVI
jgi:hypothetical protein